MLREFWKEGLFEELDARYYRLINRAHHVEDEVDVDALGDYSPFETFREIFNGAQRRPPGLLRQDDPLRLQDPAAGAAPGRGPGLDGARARVAGAAARPPPDRARGDDPGRHQVPRRRHEAHLQARDRQRSSPARSSSGPTRWASRCRSRSGCEDDAREFVEDVLSSDAAQRPRADRQRQGPRGDGGRGALRAQGLGPALARALAALLPRPRARVPKDADDERTDRRR